MIGRARAGGIVLSVFVLSVTVSGKSGPSVLLALNRPKAKGTVDTRFFVMVSSCFLYSEHSGSSVEVPF